jgi:hypothetical protein
MVDTWVRTKIGDPDGPEFTVPFGISNGVNGNLEVAVPIGAAGPPVPAPAPPGVAGPAVPPAAAPVPATTAAPVLAPAPGSSDGDPEIIWHPGSKVEIEGFVLSQK